MHFFYSTEVSTDQITLRDQELQHLSKSLRIKPGEELWLLDGLGSKYLGVLLSLSKKEATVRILEKWQEAPPKGKLHLAIGPTKNVSRMEWLIEKATEIGLWHLSFVDTERSERSRINVERMNKIAISALKQSGNLFLPNISDLQTLSGFIKNQQETGHSFIAHCETDNLPHLAGEIKMGTNVLVLIGPEGDFTQKEIELCRNQGFKEISLGSKRLRTETAGIFVTSLVAILNRY